MKTKIKPKFLLVLFILTAYYMLNTCFPSGRAHLAWAEDKIIAIVNQDVITQKDLADFLNFTRLQLTQEYKGKELEEKIQSMKVALLTRLIEDRLILQEAKKNNFAVDEVKIRTRINEVKKEYASDLQFQAELMSQGLTQGDIEKKIREQFMMFGIIEQKVRGKITVKPDEVTEFYQKHRKDLNTGERRNLEAISLENYDLARTLAYELRAGKKLEDLASRYPLIVNNFTVNSQDGLKKEMAEAISKLGINEVSDPAKIEDKYYIFRLIGITTPEELTLTQAQGRIHALLFERKMQEGLTRWLDELKKNSYIKIMQD